MGGEVDGAGRQLDGPADGQMDRSDSSSLTDQKNPTPPPPAHSDLGFPEQNILGASVSNSRRPFLSCLTAAETQS